MYYSNDGPFLVLIGILGILIIITFFVMAFRLKRIMSAIEGLAELELRKPENRKNIKCEKCQNEFSVSVLKKSGNVVTCPSCHQFTSV